MSSEDLHKEDQTIPTYLKDITKKVQEGLSENKKIIILNGEDHVPTGGANGDEMRSMFKQQCGKPLFIEAGKQIALIQCLERAGIPPNEICLLGEYPDVKSIDTAEFFSAMGFREYSLLKNISHYGSNIRKEDREGGAVSGDRLYVSDIIMALGRDRNKKGMVFSIGTIHLLGDFIEKWVIKLGKQQGFDIKVIKTFSDNGSLFSDNPLKDIIPRPFREMVFGKNMSDKELQKHLNTKYFPNIHNDNNKYFENLCKKVLFEEIKLATIESHRKISTRMQLFTMPNCPKTVVKIEGLTSDAAKKLNGQKATLQGVKNSQPFTTYERYICTINNKDGSTRSVKIRPIKLQLVLEPDPQLSFPLAPFRRQYPKKEELYQHALDNLEGGKRRRKITKKRRKKRQRRRKNRRKTKKSRKKRRN